MIGTQQGSVAIVDVEMDTTVAVLLENTRAIVQSLSWAFPHLPVLVKENESDERTVRLKITTKLHESEEFVLCTLETNWECYQDTNPAVSVMDSLIAAGIWSFLSYVE